MTRSKEIAPRPFVPKFKVSQDQLMTDRPKLSLENVDRFYEVLERMAKTESEINSCKNVFLLLQLHPMMSYQTIAERLEIPKEVARRALITVLRIIYDLENDTEDYIGSRNFIKPEQILNVRPPRPYKYTDQHGKEWWCVNEFFGLV